MGSIERNEPQGAGGPRWRPVVAVPARDEADRLPILLSALAAQSGIRPDEPLIVELVLNNCRDASARVAARVAATLPRLSVRITDIALPPDMAHVGTARRLAMDRAAAHDTPSRPVAVLTTDADAAPDPDWIDQTLKALDAGAEIVGGHIRGDPREEATLPPGVRRRAARQLAYARLRDRLACALDPIACDPWPRHQDHTGASLALPAAVYRRLGGLPPLPFREDLALVAAARAVGCRIVHPLAVRVQVSARTTGRAPGGMADCLRAWTRAEADAAPHLVEAPDGVEARLRRRAALRLAMDWAALEREADDPDAPGTVPVETAIAWIENRLRDLRVEPEAAEAA